MSHSFNPQSDSTLDQLDRQLHELPRQNGHVLNLDAFRRQLENPSRRHIARRADTRATHAVHGIRRPGQTFIDAMQ